MKKSLTLNNGNTIPIIGFGTWKLNGEVVKSAIRTAIETGYRHIDTADRYGNHIDIADVLDEEIVPREELFISTKLWMNEFHRDDVYASCQRFLKELRTDYIDLLLMHWPDRSIPFSETLTAMKDLHDRGMVKNIGVSNFTIHHLEDALKTGVQISVNQIEFHPSFYQKELKKFCDDHGIVITAYSPIGQGTELELPLMKELAEKYGKSPAQVILNWIFSKDVVAIPKATEPEFIKDNFKALDWDLDPQDIEKIDSLDLNNRVFNPPFADFGY